MVIKLAVYILLLHLLTIKHRLKSHFLTYITLQFFCASPYSVGCSIAMPSHRFGTWLLPDWFVDRL